MAEPFRAERPMSQYVIPLPASLWTPVTITGPFPLTAEEWDYLMHVLDVMKPGLVREPARPADETPAAGGSDD